MKMAFLSGFMSEDIDDDCNLRVCAECFKTVEGYGSPCVAIMDMCVDYYWKCQCLTYRESYQENCSETVQVAKFLESKGYIVTTETSSEFVAIIPNFTCGYWDKNMSIFCWGKCKQRLADSDSL